MDLGLCAHAVYYIELCWIKSYLLLKVNSCFPCRCMGPCDDQSFNYNLESNTRSVLKGWRHCTFWLHDLHSSSNYCVELYEVICPSVLSTVGIASPGFLDNLRQFPTKRLTFIKVWVAVNFPSSLQNKLFASTYVVGSLGICTVCAVTNVGIL